MKSSLILRRCVAPLMLAVAALALAAPSALAEFAPTNVEVSPETTNAGSNSDLTLSFDFSDPDEQVRDLTVSLPPGLIGNPTVPETCTQTQLEADECPAESQVGTVTTDVTAYPTDPLPIPVPLTVEGSIYNFTPQPGEPARFGIVLRPVGGLLGRITLQSGVELRPDFGLDTVLEELPTESNGLRTDITSMELTLNGSVNGGGFIRKPTSCATHSVAVSANSYITAERKSASDTFATVDCAQLPFTPEFQAISRTDGPNDRTVELTTRIKQTIDEAGLRTARVILPATYGANQERIASQNVCDVDDFYAGACPERSVVGSAVAETPVLDEPIAGDVTVVTADPDADPVETSGLPRLGLDLRGPLNLQLLGQFVLQTEPRVGTGVQFDDLPDIPISNFELTFDGDENGLTQSGFDICDPNNVPTFDLTFSPYTGEPATGFSQASETVCRAAPGRPTAKVSLFRERSKRPAIGANVRRGAVDLERVRLALPKGLRITDRGAIRVFADGERVERVGVAKRSVNLTGLDARRLRVRLDRGSLKRTVAAKRLRRAAANLSVRDAEGKVTRIRARLR